MKIREIEKELSSYGIEDARGESYLIVEKLFGVSRATLLVDRERDFSSSELDLVLAKRKERIPLQYIFGKWEFMGKEFYVSPECLIPQPDTEILTEKAIEIIKNRTQGEGFDKKCKMQNAKCKIDDRFVTQERLGDEEFEVADLCTGSGCIGLSLLMYADVDKMTLMDISRGALDMAEKNASHHGLANRCEFILGDIKCDMPKKKYDLIVSNPPYIPSGDIEGLPEEVKKEPKLALDGGHDGLDLIRFLIGDGLSYLKENGVMLIEFGYDQGHIMNELLRKKRDTGSIKSYEILRDYGNNPRVAVIYAN